MGAVSINPFRPTFGVAPPTLSGRDAVLDRLSSAMEAGPTHPDFTMLIASPRGSGKTVLLSAMRQAAEDAGWVTARATATPEEDFAGLLTEQMTRAVRDHPDRRARRRIESAHVSVFGVGAGISVGAESDVELVVHTRLLRTMEALAGLAEETGTGALITIDEFHNANLAGARSFAHALQDVSKIDGRPVMFVGAGLPKMEETVLADDGMTFFQRAARVPIKPLSDPESAWALEEPLHRMGCRMHPEALAAAVSAASGYPFMVQLVGYHSWQHCPDPVSGIAPEHVRLGVAEANAAMEEQVLRPVWRDLSVTDRRVLVAMSRFDELEVGRCDLMERMGRPSGYLSTYESRLADAGVIYRPSRGRLRFVHAAMRDWLRREHGPTAHEHADDGDRDGLQPPPTVKDRIIDAHREDPEATHSAIAKRLDTHPGYVGRIRRALR